MKELPKAYDPKQYEDAVYARSDAGGFFGPQKNDSDHYFSIVLPPPNVTGTLHMGHAAMLAIEDVMTRYHRMKGEKTLWVPGTDHAAVATESKVESLLIKNEGYKKPKVELGREAFLDRVRQFAKESHDTIVNQSKKMGASLDWSREAYTLDEVRNRAVRLVFKKMYDDGLIYRGYRVVNWSVKGQSTCSDDELVYVERPAKLYTFKYSHDFPIPIATTRPETKLGDTAVAVHPEGKWKQYIGQTFTVKNVGQAGHDLAIKIIADVGVDENFGTGALGVTPAHSMIDFEMYQRQKAANDPIGLLQVIGENGQMTNDAGGKYAGLAVKAAREQFVEYLREHNLLIEEKEVVQNVSTSDRFKDVVEPLPKVQWFVDVNKKFVLPKSNIKGITSGQEVSLKELMQTVVKTEQIQIIPERFEKTYFHWIDNLRDWCISRQIWFGHQIPVYYDIKDLENADGIVYLKDGTLKNEEGVSMFAITFDTVCKFVKQGKFSWKELKAMIVGVNTSPCKKYIACVDQNDLPESWVQDPDTLDTWFSSGLWTFSTLLEKNNFEKYQTLEDWLAHSDDFKQFHPTTVLETGYDILFFWVARMILMTTYAIGDVPFKTVYLHGLVRDEQGRKMSKTLDNIINPLDMIDTYGADATRLSLLVGTGPGNDLKLSEEKIAGFRNFTNKLWNICRFMLLTIENPKIDCAEPQPKTLFDRWFLDQLNDTVKLVSTSLDQYQFSGAGELLRTFTWDSLADWYLEIAKIEGDKSRILNYALNTILKLWHPFMPFVTEAIWSEMYGEGSPLLVAAWPKAVDLKQDESVLNDVTLIRDCIVAIRTARADNKIEPSKKIKVSVAGGVNTRVLQAHAKHLTQLRTGVEEIKVEAEVVKPANALVLLIKNVSIFVDLAGAVDVDKEKKRLTEELERAEKYVSILEKKLSNQEFINKAPKTVVDAENKKLNDCRDEIKRIKDQLYSL